MTLSIASLLAESARRWPSRTALISDGTRLSYGQLWDQARRYAAVLRDHGVGPGDRVALMMPNLPQFPMTYYGALALGAVIVPIHSLLKSEEIAYVLSDAEASVFVCAAPFLAEGEPGAKLAGVPLLSVLDGPDPGVERLDLLAAAARARGGAGAVRSARRRGPALHVGHHGQAQGRGALAPDHGHERADLGDAASSSCARVTWSWRCCRCSTRSARRA